MAEQEATLATNIIQAQNGTQVLFLSKLTRGSRQFDLSIFLSKWEAPETIADYLRIYADLLENKKAMVNNIESIDQ